MKKLLSLILTIVICVSLCACGEGGKEYVVGETIKTENWEVTLTKVTFGTNLCKEPASKDYMIVDGDYNKTVTVGGQTYNLAYVAEDGKAFVAIAYTMKYTGKTKIYRMDKWPQFYVDYNDGYKFKDNNNIVSLHAWNGEKFETVENYDLEPLSPQIECRDYFDVPLEVKDNTEAEVIIVLDLGKDGTYRYKIR